MILRLQTEGRTCGGLYAAKAEVEGQKLDGKKLSSVVKLVKSANRLTKVFIDSDIIST